MAMRRNPFVKVGRPPSTGAGAGARPKLGAAKIGMGVPSGAGAGLGMGKLPGGPAPMQGMSTAVPAAAFRRGGSVGGFKRQPHFHDDARLGRGNSEHGFASSDSHFDGMCSGGKVR
jgi:hypothetical protein